MAKKRSEYDYLYISARIHAMENRMLTRERMERMLDARTAEDAAKVLTECGYEDFPALTPAAIEHLLDQARLELFADLRKASPDPGIVDVFCIKYDYHNAKVLLKAAAMGTDPAGLFIDAGRCPVRQLREDFEREDLDHCTPVFRQAVAEARGVLASSADPQAADLILDRAYYEEMLQAARSVNSRFLEGYVRLSIDSANLRSAVRSARMGRGADFLKRVLIQGGNVKLDSLIAAATGGADLAGVFARTQGHGGRTPHRVRAAVRQRRHRLSDPGQAGGLRGAPPHRLPLCPGGGAHHHPDHPDRTAGGPGYGRHPGKAA